MLPAVGAAVLRFVRFCGSVMPTYLMPKKRTSPESDSDEQTTDGSDVLQQNGSAKRARLTPASDTTLQDLPNELTERFLVKAVASEVIGMKLARRVWKEKAELVINRLRTVCPQWNTTLTTNYFRAELQRNLDGAAVETVHMEILRQHPIVLPPESIFVKQLISLKDEIFMLCKSRVVSVVCNVYDRNNMAAVKDVIQLPGLDATSIAACYVANCVYVLSVGARDRISILRVTKGADHKFTVSPLISDLWMPHPTLSVAADGCLILSMLEHDRQLAVISIYDATGSFKHEIRLTKPADLGFYQIIPKSNGNLVLVSSGKSCQMQLTEIDMNGNMVRQYLSSIGAYNGVCDADKHGRIFIAEKLNRVELLDSELNLLEFTGRPNLDESNAGVCGCRFHYCSDRMHYDRERDEIVEGHSGFIETSFLTIFHFTEE